MGIFFDDPKPRITKLEWEKIRSNLHGNHNFSTEQLNKIEEIFRGDIDETKEKDKGIDTEELVRGIQYMREHIDVHHIPIEKINTLEMEMMKYIAKY